MRCFVAVEIPDEIKDKLAKLQKELGFVKGKLVEIENMHLTLKFLGEVDKVDELFSVLKRIEFSPFELELSGCGGFPSKNYVKVLWVGGKDGEKEFMALQKKIDSECAKLGFKKDERYGIHLTLVRVKVVDKRELNEFFKKYDGKSFGKFKVEKFALFESKLSSSGPQYKKLGEFTLG